MIIKNRETKLAIPVYTCSTNAPTKLNRRFYIGKKRVVLAMYSLQYRGRFLAEVGIVANENEKHVV